MADHARSDDAAVQAQLDRFAQLSPGRDILGLERISRLMTLLGDPHRRLPPVFHVAGTNGKGSTCAFLRAMLEAGGHSVHAYTSPHLVRFNERIRVAGRLIADDALAPLLAEVLDAAEADGLHPSFFEATSAAALLAFSRTPADACVIEVGLGGRLDATNIIETPLVCGIAQVGIDHQSFLGETLGEIAGEKAGIAKPGVPLVVMAQPDDALAAITRVATMMGAPMLYEGRDWTSDGAPTPALPGAHQRRNAALAAAMIRAQSKLAVSAAAIRFGVEHAVWPGRLQLLSDGPLTMHGPVWIDGAHNEDAARVLAEAIAGRKPHMILGILANKHATAIIGALAPHASSLTFVPVPGHEHHDPVALAAQWGGCAAPDLMNAIAGHRGDHLIAGSLYLIGEALRLNHQLPD